MTHHDMTPKQWIKKHRIIRGVIIFVLLLVCALEYKALIRDVYETRIASVLFEKEIQVEPWMTFRYINTVYDLSPEYLKNYFSIESSQYPDIRLGRYVIVHTLDQDVFIRSVEEAINRYRY